MWQPESDGRSGLGLPKGIVQGYEDGSFRPDEGVTGANGRHHVPLCRLGGYNTGIAAGLPFSDSADISSYAKPRWNGRWAPNS